MAGNGARRYNGSPVPSTGSRADDTPPALSDIALRAQPGAGMTRRFDAIVVGAGQAGPSLAVRLAGSGRTVAVVERHLVGGTCVNTGGKSANATPGAVTRRGPMKGTGLARSDRTGSVRMLRPLAWASIVACPTAVTVRPSARAAGFAASTATD
jgi:hypothetical protein